MADRPAYGQCWEDADLLVEALQPLTGRTVLSIGSGGDNSLALLAEGPARLLVLLGLGLLGARLGALLRTDGDHQVPPAPLLLALLLKLLLLPLLLWWLCRHLALESLVTQAVVLQGATPPALAVLLQAERAAQGAEAASALVLLGTLLSLVSLPLWGWWLTVAAPGAT